ncbi:protein-methionine sulfoxide oxidase mical3a isoform X3 [Anastrepha obliqua]|uniref:protein-methionine sulfoxide oxidase mical3a isoform X3 n=1 Tax=Anastrepha obliqua TaxID=95512 RepID=UPI0024092C28|nr:protein-methionine sulfoxide oxidase mical3a isoform X3 [Anastrepha obliqua]
MAERRGTKALELWCRRMTEGYPGVKIDNMTTSWRDGLAFCAMIHHFRPDLIEFDKLNKADVYYNNELAFTTAEKYLGIPALLDAVDMATYEVPDRLSILTYLSQFYQVFAAQDSPNRLKRPSPTASAEKTQITKAAGPPPKMAHVVGVPKRDPCQKCQLPVFLAERLLVGKKVYHRTCLKCARCGSQLTPGSFYETEVDGEYCCETCPDEETLLNSATGVELAAGGVELRHASEEQTPSSSSFVMPKAARSSIAERLAFFEQSNSTGARKSGEVSSAGKFLLQKSVSDEEKSKSLQRMEAPTTTSAYKMNSALSNFLSNTIDRPGEDTDSLTSLTVESKSDADTQMETSDTENDTETETSLEDVAPALPKTQPPSVIKEKNEEKEELASEIEKKKVEKVPVERFTTTAQLQLSGALEETEKAKVAAVGDRLQVDDQAKETNGNSTEKSNEKNKSELQLNLTTALTATKSHTATANIAESSTHTEQPADNANNNDHQDVDLKSVSTKAAEEKAQTSLTTAINLDLSEPNSNEDVTKDQIADTNVIDAVTAQPQMQVQPKTTNIEKLETLRANLSELDTESRTENTDTAVENPAHKGIKALESLEHLSVDDRLNVVRARLQQFDVIVISNKRNNNADDEKSSDNDTSIDNKLSDSEVDRTNTSSDKKVLNTGHKVATKANVGDEVGLTSLSPLKSNATNVTKSVTKANLEDEAKLRAMGIEKSEQVEAKTQGNKENVSEVPLEMEIVKDNKVELNVEESKLEQESSTLKETAKIEISEVETNDDDVVTSVNATPEKVASTPIIISPAEYPEDLNPFKSEDEEDEELTSNKENNHKPAQAESRTPQSRASNTSIAKAAVKAQNLNPFDSSDDEVELEKTSRSSTAASTPSSGKVPPPRPPPPRISRNPFGEETAEDVANFSRRSSLSSSLTKKTPVPTPRTNISLSQNPTPEPTPRLSSKSEKSASSYILQNSSDFYGSANSLGSTNTSYNNTPQSLQRNTDARGSNNSFSSSAGGTIRSRKTRKAPQPPTLLAKELFPASTPPPANSDRQTDSSKASTPSSSTVGTPKLSRKKRPAPAPPKPARLDPSLLALEQQQQQHHTNDTAPKNSFNYPLQGDTSDSKLSDEEKALLEGKQLSVDSIKLTSFDDEDLTSSRRSSRRIIPLDASLLEDEHDADAGSADANGGGSGTCDDAKQKQQLLRYSEQEESNVVYRRVIVPPSMETPTRESNPLFDSLHDRQLEKLKDNKEAQNRNRQSQISASSGTEDCDISSTPYNKSAHGKWKRRKGPAPALPIPPRKVLQMLPLQEIRHELEIIEVQQQGLEKQGVILEKMIRDRCEGQNGELLGANNSTEDTPDGRKASTSGGENVQNSKEVEDLILQLFELVNEKNELFRRQAELMYLAIVNLIKMKLNQSSNQKS